MNRFEQALKFMLEHEGFSYTDTPNDLGGKTKFGITESTLMRWRGLPVSAEDIKNLTLEEAQIIYRAWYWEPLELDFVTSDALAIAFFDQAVNRGAFTVAIQLQKILGIKIDGKIGPQTLAQINAQDPKKLLIDFFKNSQFAYASIVKRNPAQSDFLAGWLNRTHDLLGLISL